ncbi:hypothetical protein ED236_11505 [Pseudomethylobacillus aquaticus]|uniref:Uncharacterized protein n=1 Tax=Pseudomethylobacillus aquaticus TaxID=2676064 RepID=A0A3N0UWG6_9PROT|nr:hypothetical protein [Pseudomethylobacillus aquaticus]ROH84538.1 hypothetical protein ED236_11505 [Pseudomethylobacillus aquaticus]
MILIFLVLLLAAIPLVLSNAFPQLVLVSVYAGLAHVAGLAWVVLILTIIARRQRIADWRAQRKQRRSNDSVAST